MTKLGYISLNFKIAQEGEDWTGECIELGTATYGSTPHGVWKELQELVELHLNGLEEEGERDRFFKDNNIVVYPSPQQPENHPFTLGGGIFPEVMPFQYAV